MATPETTQITVPQYFSFSLAFSRFSNFAFSFANKSLVAWSTPSVLFSNWLRSNKPLSIVRIPDWTSLIVFKIFSPFPFNKARLLAWRHNPKETIRMIQRRCLWGIFCGEIVKCKGVNVSEVLRKWTEEGWLQTDWLYRQMCLLSNYLTAQCEVFVGRLVTPPSKVQIGSHF